jgi:hypothetical protein
MSPSLVSNPAWPTSEAQLLYFGDCFCTTNPKLYFGDCFCTTNPIQRKLLVTTEPQRSQTQPGTPLAVHQVDHTQGTCCSAPDQQGTSSNHSRPQPHTVQRVRKASTDPRPQRTIHDSRNPALPLLPLNTYHLTHQRHTGTLYTGCANRCNEAAAPQPSTSKTASSWFATATSLTVQGAKLA